MATHSNKPSTPSAKAPSASARGERKVPGTTPESTAVAVEDPKEFRKTNEAIGLRVKEGHLSLLSRKIFNVMMYRAQLMKETGINSPISTPASKKYFWMPLGELARDAAYDSRDTEQLKEQIEEIQNIKLVIENERQWTSERLLASVTILKAGQGRTSPLWIGFAFPPEVHELVMAPGIYTKLSIVYQGMLRSNAALALYEICRRYLTNPSKLTMALAYEEWHGILTGNPINQAAVPDYKYFKRDVLKRAIAEINAATDIEVELVEHKKGRSVLKIQFRVERSRQAPLELVAPPMVDTETTDGIEKLGFSKQEAQDLVALHGSDKAREAIGQMEARLNSSVLPKVVSKKAFFLTILKFTSDEPEPPSRERDATFAAKPKPEPPALGSTLQAIDAYYSYRSKQAMEAFGALDKAEQEALLASYKKAEGDKLGKGVARGLESPMVRATFARWFAKNTWGEPTVGELEKFLLQQKGQ